MILRPLTVWALLAGIITSLFLAHSISVSSCTNNLRHDKSLQVNGRRLFLQTAVSSSDLQKGLGGRNCLPADEGMLFVFNRPDYYPFWMKDTSIPLDMIWLNADKKVVYEQKNVKPETYSQTFVSKEPAQYVIELKAGQAGKLNIQNGTNLSF